MIALEEQVVGNADKNLMNRWNPSVDGKKSGPANIRTVFRDQRIGFLHRIYRGLILISECVY
jgi:hypothetical protein